MLRVLLLAIGMFALGLDAYVLAGLLPGISQDFDSSIAATGQIVTAFTLSYALLSPLLAVLAAAADRRAILIGGLLVFALANVGSMLSPTLWMLMLTRVIAGLAAGLYAPAAAATAAGLVPAAARGRALALVLGGLSAATVFGVPLGLLLAEHFGWRSVLLLIVTLALIAAVGVAAWLPSIKASTPSLGERLTVLSDRAVLGRIAVMLFAAMASLGLYTYLAPLLLGLTKVSPSVLPGYFFLWGVAGLAGNAVAGFLLDHRISSSRMLTVSLTVMAIVLLLFPIVGTSSMGAAAILLMWGATAWSLQVPIQHQLADITPEHAATTIALLASSIYLGSAIGSGLGAIVLTTSLRLLGPMAAVSTGIALIVHLRGARKSHA